MSELLDKDVFRTDRHIDFFHPSPSSLEDDLELGNLKILQRILCTYCVWDPEIGTYLTKRLMISCIEYVQGMNDLLSPILYVIHDEALSFWAFNTLMKHQVEITS